MKKYLLVAACLLLSIASNAQVIISLLLGDKLNTGKIEFGLDGGVSFSTIKNLDQAKYLRRFNLGFYFDFKLKNPSWMINTGVMVKSTMGADMLPVYTLGDPALDSAFLGGRVARKINYFQVPVMMKYKFKNNIYLKAGFQLSLRHKAIDEFRKTVNDKDDLKYKVKIKGNYHSIDAGLAAGIGYRLMGGNGMNIGAQYYYGLANILKDKSVDKQYHRAIYLTVGIPVGVNKARKKAAKKEAEKIQKVEQ